MGLSSAEASALKITDINFINGTLTVSRVLTRKPNDTSKDGAKDAARGEKWSYMVVPAGTFESEYVASDLTLSNGADIFRKKLADASPCLQASA